MDEHLLRFDKDKSIVFIDCETFNLCLNKSHTLPWQISMVRLQGDKIVAEKDYHVKWDTHLSISDEAARITRFSQSKLNKLGLPPEEVLPTVIDWLDSADYVSGHNLLGFDLYLIKDFYAFMGQDYKHLVNKIIDTLSIARGVKLGLKFKSNESFLAYQYRMNQVRKRGLKTSLAALGKEYEIQHDYANLHDALTDLKLNVKIWNKLKWQVDI